MSKHTKGTRHRARQRALEILFSREFHEENDIQYAENEILRSGAAEDETDDEVVLAAENEYCEYLVATTTAHVAEFDTIIQSLSKKWDLSQINRANKNIMRLTLCELIYPKEAGLAASIVINEAIVLAREYSDDQSARFVNGILGAYTKERA